MRRSITSLICGLIGSIFSLAWGFIFGIVGEVGTAATSATSSGPDGTLSLIYVLGWLCFLGAILGIVGASLSVKKARAGAIWLTIATVMCAPLQIYAFAKLQVTTMIMANIIVCLLPTILLAVACVFAWLAKKVNSPEQLKRQTVGETTSSSVSGLESELLKLKETFEKGLITEEEFNEARKKIINKHM